MVARTKNVSFSTFSLWGADSASDDDNVDDDDDNEDDDDDDDDGRLQWQLTMIFFWIWHVIY